ncbi:hypothetical protein D3C73_1129840 [compost metagenome]
MAVTGVRQGKWNTNRQGRLRNIGLVRIKTDPVVNVLYGAGTVMDGMVRRIQNSRVGRKLLQFSGNFKQRCSLCEHQEPGIQAIGDTVHKIVRMSSVKLYVADLGH